MVSSTKNDRSTTTTKTTETKGAAGPDPNAPLPEEDAEDMSLVAAEGKSDPAARMERPKLTRPIDNNPPSISSSKAEGVRPTTSQAVMSDLADSIRSLQPGEEAEVGAKLDTQQAGLSIGAEGAVKFERAADGSYVVSVDQRALVGFAEESGKGDGDALRPNGERKVEVAGRGLVGGELKFSAGTPEEAIKIAAEVTLAIQAGQALMPFAPLVGAAGGAAVAAKVNAAKLSEAKVEIGVSAELEAAFDVGEQLKNKLGVEAESTAGLVFVAPDQAFLELTYTVGGSAGQSLGGENALELAGGEAEGTITVRVPVGKVSSPDDLNDPAVQRSLVDAARQKPPGTTTTFEGEIKGGSLPLGAKLSVEKEVDGFHPLDVLHGDGFETAVQMEVGPRISATFGESSVELGVRRSVNLRKPEGDTLEAQMSDVGKHKAELESDMKARARAEKPK
jgi:hypothetical protein